MESYKFYLKSSSYFSEYTITNKINAEEKKYNYLASILLSWIALESFVNVASESLSIGSRLKSHEKAFLEEKELKVDDDGIFQSITIRPSTSKKILFLLYYFTKQDIKKFKQTEMWKNLKSFEDLRNKIIHHKEKNNIEINKDKTIKYKILVEEIIKFLKKKLK